MPLNVDMLLVGGCDENHIVYRSGSIVQCGPSYYSLKRVCVVELEACVGKCVRRAMCFIVQKYVMCNHAPCFYYVINFKFCAACGSVTHGVHMHSSKIEDVEMTPHSEVKLAMP